MVDYETYCLIKRYADEDCLSDAQIAAALALDVRTVGKWRTAPRFTPKAVVPRPSKLDPYKGHIVRWLDTHPYSAMQIFQRLKPIGYEGGYSILKDYIRTIRPARAPAYLTLSFEPGECAQVDWGSWGSVNVGRTRRRLSFFVMVLCYSRMMYVEFTLGQTMEQFLACHMHAFEALGGVPQKIMVDNLKSAVLKRVMGEPVFNPRYLDFSQHYGFTIKPCNVRKGNEKGRVESGVGYVKKNFLNGLEIADFAHINPAVQTWLKEIANVRIHGETKVPPIERHIQERQHLKALHPNEYDVATTQTVRASNRFRVTWETNRYSVPSEYASQRLTLKCYPDRLCIYQGQDLIARHGRSYDRHQDFEHPDHPRALLQQRTNAREQRLIARFLTLSPLAEQYYRALEQRRLNVRHHVRHIVALSEIHGNEAIARALEDAFHFQAFSSEYIANLLEQRARFRPEPGVLHLSRAQDHLDIELEEPDLAPYSSTLDPIDQEKIL